MAELSLDVADKIANDCLAEGKRRGLQPLTVAVLDSGGHLVVGKRGDGAGILRNEIAYGKAWGALGMGLPSRVLATRSKDMPRFFDALASVSQGRIIPVPGGVLVRTDQGKIVGAVGISGDTSDNDEVCAVAAIENVGLIADIGM